MGIPRSPHANQAYPFMEVLKSAEHRHEDTVDDLVLVVPRAARSAALAVQVPLRRQLLHEVHVIVVPAETPPIQFVCLWLLRPSDVDLVVVQKTLL